MPKIFFIICFCISLIIAIKNVVESFLIELDIRRGADPEVAVENRKFRFRKVFRRIKETKQKKAIAEIANCSTEKEE